MNTFLRGKVSVSKMSVEVLSDKGMLYKNATIFSVWNDLVGYLSFSKVLFEELSDRCQLVQCRVMFNKNIMASVLS